MTPAGNHRFDRAARAIAGGRSRRAVLRGALGCAILGAVGISLAGCGDETDEPISVAAQGEGVISCDDCMTVVGIVADEAIGTMCSQMAGRGIAKFPIKNPWAVVLAGAVCLTKYLLPGYDRQAVCAHGTTDRILSFVGGAPCQPASCDPDEVLCGVPGGGPPTCAPRCSGDRVLDQTTCTCTAREGVAATDPTVSLPGEAHTGGGSTGRWYGRVQDASVLIAQARRLEVDGRIVGENGVQVAFPANTPIELAMADGAFWVVPESMAPTTFCDALKGYRAEHGELAVVSGLPEWGTAAPCNPSGAAGAEAVYRSANYGYALPYVDSWTLDRSASWLVGDGSGGYDQVRFRHSDGKTLIALTGTPQWGSDLAACVAGVRAGIDDLDNTGRLDAATGVDLTPLALTLPAGEPQAVTYDLTDGTISERRVAFIECFELIPGGASLVVLFETTADEYAAQEAERDRFLRALTFGAPPVTSSQPPPDDEPSLSPTIAPKR